MAPSSARPNAQQIAPPASVLLLVGREDFTAPRTFAGQACAATHDCVAVAVVTALDSPTTVTLGPTGGGGSLLRLADVVIESEGLVSLRDVHNREYDAMGVPPGHARVVVWGDVEQEPTEVVVQVTPVDGPDQHT